jgi:acyl-[acyl carrier protein]--UDP-N-acetylglucosamine O-acyltransferase
MPDARGQFNVIAADVAIGEGTRLGNFVFIRGNTAIGTGCTIGSYVDIEGDVAIGSGVSLQSGCYITCGVVIEGRLLVTAVITMSDKRIRPPAARDLRPPRPAHRASGAHRWRQRAPARRRSGRTRSSARAPW